MTNIIKIANSLDDDEWTKFCDSSPVSTPFHELSWRDLIQAEYGFKPQYYLIKDGGKTVGILPMFLVHNLTGKKLVSMPFSMYAGPLFLNSDETAYLPEVLDLIAAHGKSIGAKRIAIAAFNQVNARHLKTYLTETDSFLNIDQPTFDSYLESLHYKVRYEIRKGEKLNFSVKIGLDQNTVDNFYELFSASRQKLKLPVPRKSYIQKLATIMNGNFVTIYLDQTIVSAGLVLKHKNDLYNVYNATSDQVRKLNPGYLLYANMIKFAYEHQTQRIYFGGSPQESLLAFKKKWNINTRQEYCYSNQPMRDQEVRTQGIPGWGYLPKSMRELASHLVLKYAY